MKGIKGWFRRNNLIMLQAQDLARQLKQAWNDNKKIGDDLTASNFYVTARWNEETERADNLQAQLHRVARERDQERKKRIDAEGALLDHYLDKREKRLEAEAARVDRYTIGDKTLKEAANELRDEHLESVQICTCDHSTLAGFHDEDCPQFNEEERWNKCG